MQALYKYALHHLVSGSSRGEAKALKGGAELLLPELHAGEGFDAEQVGQGEAPRRCCCDPK